MFKKIFFGIFFTIALSACQFTPFAKGPAPEAAITPASKNNYQLEYKTTPAMQDANQTTQTVPTSTATPSANGYTAIFKTSLGDITIDLFADKAPETVANFVGLATGKKDWQDPKTNQKVSGKSLYAGTIFHRVIDGFMIQGGDPLGQGIGGPGYKFKDEFNSSLKFDKPYILAMANAGPNTNGSQFFITVAETPWLNNKHTIFGIVTKGQEVVDKIATTPTGPSDKPLTDVVLKSVEIIEK